MLILAGIGPAQAADPWDLPPQVVQSFEGNGWASIAVTTDGSPYNLDVSMPYLTRSSQIAMLPYDAAGKYTGGVISTGLNDGETTYRADLGTIPGVSIHEREYVRDGALPGGKLYLHIEVNYPPRETPFVGTIRWVFYGVSRQPTAWNWSLEAAPGGGVTYGTPLSGSKAFLALARDFEQETGAGATANVNANSVGARASYKASYERTVTSTFVGAWLNYGSGISCCPPLALSQDFLQVSSDSGYSRSCSGQCFLTDIRGPGAAGPGEYVFSNLVGASAGRDSWEDFILTGADVVLAEA